MAAGAGLVTKNQLRGPAYTRLFRGIYVRRGLEADASVRFAALRLHLNGGEGVVRGLTAAWLHGVWRPAPGDDLPLEFARSPRKLGHDLTTDLVPSGGLLVTSPQRTCFDLMRRSGLVEAVVVADAFAATGTVSLPVLAGYCEDRRRWPEVRHARLAVTLAHPGARSPGETRLRMVVVLAGFEEPLVNVPVHDLKGAHLGTPDLTVPGRSWVHLEYDGAYHDEAAQHGRDLRRQNALIGYGGVPCCASTGGTCCASASACCATWRSLRVNGHAGHSTTATSSAGHAARAGEVLAGEVLAGDGARC